MIFYGEEDNCPWKEMLLPAKQITDLPLVLQVILQRSGILFLYRQIQIWNLPFFLQSVIYRSRTLSLLWGKIWFGVNGIDRELSKLVGTKRGFFVELGGNDGIAQSNTKHLELFRGWRGVLVEPFPKNFQLMRKNRSPRTHCVNAACVSFDYLDAEILLSYANLMTTPLQGESDIFDRNAHAVSGTIYLPANEKVHTFKSKAVTLTKILDDCGAPRVIDLLSLDVEGGELEVLKGIDHERYRFKWMVIENRSPSALGAFLEDQGYLFVCQLSGVDYVYKDKADSRHRQLNP